VSGAEPAFGVPVLMYHHVEPQPLQPPPVHGDSYVTPRQLRSHLDLLARRRFQPLTLAEAARRLHTGEPLPPRPVVLTFDDACTCFVAHALPVLSRHGVTATVFAVSGEVGGRNRWDADSGERSERLLDADGLRRAATAGMEVGCHGASHADLSRLDDHAALAAETGGARRDLEALLGRPVETFCYPYGRASAAAREAVRHAGFLAAVAIHGHPGARRGDPWGVPRQPVRPGESGFEIWLKARGLYAAWSKLPRLGLLAALRRRRHGGEGPRSGPQEATR
jgi:peptidoglycan/xylan/chitin deacetylase (PgdA/CDA1 family)